MTCHSARCSQRHTEDKSTTAYQVACQSVSQSASSVMFDVSGQPDVTLNVIEAHNKFSEDTQIEQTHDRSGKPDERNSSKAQIRTLFEEQRPTIIAEYLEKVSHHELTQKKSADSYKDSYGDRNWNFVKLINKVLQIWKNYGTSRVLPSILSRNESSSRIRTLFWNCQAEYRNSKMKLPVDQCHSHLIQLLMEC